MSKGDDDEIFDDPLSAARGRQIVHNHYNTQTKNGNGNGNGVNKLVWGCAGVFALTILGINAFVGAKVWEISERLARVETTLEVRPIQPGQ